MRRVLVLLVAAVLAVAPAIIAVTYGDSLSERHPVHPPPWVQRQPADSGGTPSTDPTPSGPAPGTGGRPAAGGGDQPAAPDGPTEAAVAVDGGQPTPAGSHGPPPVTAATAAPDDDGDDGRHGNGNGGGPGHGGGERTDAHDR